MNLAIKVKCIQTGRCTWDGSETISSNVAARSAIVLALSSKPWHVAFHDSDKRVERSVVSLPPPCCCSNAAGKFERESAAAASKPSAASASPFSMSADTASDVFSTVAITLGGAIGATVTLNIMVLEPPCGSVTVTQSIRLPAGRNERVVALRPAASSPSLMVVPAALIYENVYRSSVVSPSGSCHDADDRVKIVDSAIPSDGHTPRSPPVGGRFVSTVMLSEVDDPVVLLVATTEKR